MADPSAPLSAAALRLAGHVGQTALDRIAERGLAAAAELDQHVAAVRAELAVCQQLPATAAPVVNRGGADGTGQSRLMRSSRLTRSTGLLRLIRLTRSTGLLRSSRLTRLTRLLRLAHLDGAAGRGRKRTNEASDLQARLAELRSATATCPDVPFVSSALQAETTVPVSLLLHYAAGFVEAGLSDGWWPGQSADATDWVSLRLAAICKLITQAETAAEAHPDLRASA